MSNPVTVELKNFNRLQEVASRYPQVAEKHVGYAITRALTRVMGSVKQEAPQGVSTFLKNRWTIRAGRFEGTLFSGTEYASAVHNGTRPHFVPIEDLKKWAIKKGINAYAVQKSIAKKGTRPNKFLDRAVKANESKMDKDLQDAITNIINEV